MKNQAHSMNPHSVSRHAPVVPHPRSRRASAITIGIGVIAASAVAGIAVTSISSISPLSHPTSRAESVLPTPASSAEISALLYRLGLAPDRLAASGVTAAQTTTLVGNLRSHLSDHIDALRSADADYTSSRSLVDALERLVRAGTSTSDQRTALTTAQTQLASNATTRQGVLNSAYTAATDGLAAGVLQSLARAYTNTGWELPVQASPLPYAFADRSEQDWVTLRDALSAQRIATKYGQTPDQNALDFISAASGASAVSTAAANLQANFAQVSAAWATAVAQ